MTTPPCLRDRSHTLFICALLLAACGSATDPPLDGASDDSDLAHASDPDGGVVGGDGGGTLPDGGSGCVHPVTGQPVPVGTVIESYSLSVATTQAECDASKLSSTCSAATGQFLPPPASSQTCVVEALPPAGTAFYFSDCQAGASAGCVAGDNANAGTSPTAPKRTLDGFDVNTLPAGTFVLFARGGAWVDFHLQIVNLNVTPEQPLTFGSYAPSWGGTARPWLKSHTPTGEFEFGELNNTENDGGYTIRNLKLDGDGSGMWGLWLRDVVRNVTAENLEITGFQIGVHSQSTGATGVNHFTLRSCNVHHNSNMGMLGDGIDMLIENNVFSLNNFSGSVFTHAIYLGGQGQRATVRNNVFTNNSTVNGVCLGGNFTMHGQWDGLLFENNVIAQQDSDRSCYGVSLNPGYTTAEYMRHVVVRGNTIINLGSCSVCASSTPGIIIENNVIVHGTPRIHAGITLGGDPGAGDDADSMGIIRNNTIYYTQAERGTGIQVIASAGTGVQVVSNLIYYGAGVTSDSVCFQQPGLDHFASFDYNLCFRAGALAPWSSSYATLAAAQAAGFDAHGLATDPMFTAAPTSANAYACALAATSAGVDHGHPTLSSPLGFASVPRVVPDIGACER